MAKNLLSLKNADISVDGLFINADSVFDPKELRSICELNSIKHNFAQNKRNVNEDDDLYFDELLCPKPRTINLSILRLEIIQSVCK